MSVYVQPCQYELIKLKTNIVGLRCCQTIIQSKLDSTCATFCIHIITSAAFRKRVSVLEKN